MNNLRGFNLLGGIFRMLALGSVVFSFTRGVVNRFVEFFGRLFAKKEALMCFVPMPVIGVFKGLFTLKHDKVREFFSFLRVKQSWNAG